MPSSVNLSLTDAPGGPNTSQEAIRNPPRRNRTGGAGVQREDAGRDRGTVERRKKRARSTQVSLREREALANDAPQLHIRPPSSCPDGTRVTYACPYCEKLQAQNNSSNVKQHVATYHRHQHDNFLKNCGPRKDAAEASLYVDAGATLSARVASHPRKGIRVEVLFHVEEGELPESLRQDDMWFPGLVKKSGASDVKRLTKILYDDGELVEHDFLKDDESWRNERTRPVPMFDDE